MKQFFLSRTFLYIILAIMASTLLLPALELPWSKENYDHLMHLSGEWAVRLLVFTLLITPIRLLFPKNKFLKWALRYRRQLGIAAFAFTVAHLVIYLSYHTSFSKVLEDLGDPNYLFAWGALLILIPLAVTSSNRSIRWLGFANWKKLHRAVYVATPLVALHWLLKEDGNTLGPVLVHFIPLALFQAYRIYRQGRHKFPWAKKAAFINQPLNKSADKTI